MSQLDQQINLTLGDSESVIHFTEITDDKKWLRSYIDLTLPSTLGSEVVRSVETSIPVEDWYKLCEYFEKHVSAHEAGSKNKTTVFMPSERLFRIFASTGSTVSAKEGVFPLHFSAYIRSASVYRKYFRYVQTLVQVSDIREFVRSMRAFLLRVTG